MADPHIWMVVAPFVTAVWWTKYWLMHRIITRWRFAVSALVGTLLWVYLAYASTQAYSGSGGAKLAYGSTALAYVSVFMAVVSVAGMILGLLLWAEEEGEEAADELPGAIYGRR